MLGKYILILCTLFLLCTNCKRNNRISADAEENGFPAKSINDTIQGTSPEADSVVSSDYKFTGESLEEIMDFLNKRIKETLVRHNVPGWGVIDSENRIYVDMIVYNEEKIAEFRKYVMDSPIIVFREIKNRRPEGEDCETCGFKIVASPNTYRKPLSKINVNISNDNDTGEGVSGEYFFIEYLNSGKWETVPLNYSHNSIGYPVEAGKSRNIEVNLQPETYDYKAGSYRVYKTVSYNGKSYVLIAGFIIE